MKLANRRKKKMYIRISAEGRAVSVVLIDDDAWTCDAGRRGCHSHLAPDKRRAESDRHRSEISASKKRRARAFHDDFIVHVSPPGVWTATNVIHASPTRTSHARDAVPPSVENLK